MKKLTTTAQLIGLVLIAIIVVLVLVINSLTRSRKYTGVLPSQEASNVQSYEKRPQVAPEQQQSAPAYQPDNSPSIAPILKKAPAPGVWVEGGVSNLSTTQIRVAQNQVITFTTNGLAWSEGELPVKLYDNNGNLIGSFLATSSNWMTTGPVVGTVSVFVPDHLSGSMGVLRFIDNNQSAGEAKTKYWGTEVLFK